MPESHRFDAASQLPAATFPLDSVTWHRVHPGSSTDKDGDRRTVRGIGPRKNGAGEILTNTSCRRFRRAGITTQALTRPCSDEDLLACYDLVFCPPACPHRPEAQDVALSRPKHGFESRWGRTNSLAHARSLNVPNSLSGSAAPRCTRRQRFRIPLGTPLHFASS